MKRVLLIIIAVAACCVDTTAQTADSTVFRAYLINNEYEIHMHIDLYTHQIVVPGQELFGQLPGYLQKERNAFCWMIIDAEVTDRQKARLTMVNDYGSEDLVAELKQTSDSTYVFSHLSGSPLKVPNNGKWQKLPRTFELKRKK